MNQVTPRLLVIAGSDSSAGAGLQADLKTAQHFGVYAQTAVTAVTVQDTLGVKAVHLVPPHIVKAQIEAALGDIGADAIKIGMLGNGAIAAAVAEALAGVAIPLVLDPVMMAKGGAPLLDGVAAQILKERLLPLAALVTPNLPEAEALVGIAPRSEEQARAAARAFAALGVTNVLFKGGHAFGPLRPSHLDGATATSPADASLAGEGDDDMVRDLLVENGVVTLFEAPRRHSRHTHGTGCTLATAIACGLATGLPLAEAVARAHAYVQQAIRTAPGLGQRHGPLNHIVKST
jgi:hydroxymethylpyrimidine/phosphomethylpyrimidine kinase